jgi:hypothetical protein
VTGAVVLPSGESLAETLFLRGGRSVDGELLSYDVKTQELLVRLKEGGILTLRRGDLEQYEIASAGSMRRIRPNQSSSISRSGAADDQRTYSRRMGPPSH